MDDDSYDPTENKNEEDKNENNKINNEKPNIYQNNDYNKNINEGNKINNNLNKINNNYGYEAYKNNNNIIKVNIKPDDKTFRRLKELQTLYKKESALKELFIQTSDKIKTNINDYSKDIYKKKLDVLNILQNKISGQESKKKINFV
jgi:hypothetical protein